MVTSFTSISDISVSLFMLLDILQALVDYLKTLSDSFEVLVELVSEARDFTLGVDTL